MDYYFMDNSTTPTASPADPQLGAFRVTMAVLYLAVCTLGLGGNLLVVAAILKLDRLASSTTVYILHLALADGLFMVSLPFVAAQNFRARWEFGETPCKLVMALDGVNQFTSVFCLTAMSVDRYMALAGGTSDRFARWRTPRRAWAAAAVLWLLSLAPVLPMALHFSVRRGLCMLAPPAGADPGGWWLAFLGYTFALGFLLPYALMVGCYAALLSSLRSNQRLHQRYRQVGASGGGVTVGPSPESHRLERQVTKMVVSVVLTFGACWIPFYAFNFYAVLHGGDPGAAFARAFELAVLLSYSWSCANPILYACFSDTFRCYFRTLLCRPKPPDSEAAVGAVTERYNLTEATDGRDVGVTA